MTKAKIEKITDEQWAEALKQRGIWLERALADGPVDVEKLRPSINKLYAAINKKAPEIKRFESPKQCIEEIQKLTGRAGALSECLWGSSDAAWTAYYSIIKDVLGIEYGKENEEMLEAWAIINTGTFWWWPYDGVAILCDRPKTSWDASRRLHKENGPAVIFADDYALWSWHGVRVNEQIIMRPETITVAQIAEEKNAEIQRVMIERMGPSKYMKESGCKVLDMDDLGLVGSAPRSLMEDAMGNKWLIGTDGSTKRVYTMAVPRDAKTCAEAHQMISGAPSEADLVAEA